MQSRLHVMINNCKNRAAADLPFPFLLLLLVTRFRFSPFFSQLSTVPASMADRVHPTDHSPHQPDASSNSGSVINSGDATPPPPKNPPPGTYVIQIPKDQVYRVPPPENATRFDVYTRRSNRPCPCRRLLLLLLLFGIASCLFFLILQPVSPRYSILAMSIKGIKTNSTSISPQFNVTVRAENPNKNIGIYYEKNSSVRVYFWDVMLSEGALPASYQPWSNVTVMEAKLKGSGIRSWSSAVVKGLEDSEKQGKVRLKVDVRAGMKLKVYWLKTWRIRAKVSCKIWVKNLTGETRVMEDEICNHSVKLW